MKKFVWRDVTVACLCAGGLLPVWAQQAQAPGANPGTLQRSIENVPALPKAAEKPAAPDQLDLSDLSPIEKLVRVEVRGQDNLAPAYQAYWADKIGKPVTVEALAEFKIWANDEAKENGLTDVQIMLAKIDKQKASPDRVKWWKEAKRAIAAYEGNNEGVDAGEKLHGAWHLVRIYHS